MQNDKLLPCPFCGGEARVVYAIHDYNMWGVYCGDCGANIETNEAAEADTAGNAVRLWNTRKPMERIEQQLENRKDYLTGNFLLQKKAIEVKEKVLCRINEIDNAIENVRNGGKE